MKKKKNLWFARIVSILFLGVLLAQLMFSPQTVHLASIFFHIYRTSIIEEQKQFFCQRLEAAK